MLAKAREAQAIWAAKSFKERARHIQMMRSYIVDRADDLARTVKLADLADNTDRTRLGTVTDDDERRLRKYAEARAIILGDAT